jgi:hypothetical protein
MRKTISLLSLIAVVCLLLTVEATTNGEAGALKIAAGQRFETRCGWFVNPTPANAWLNDRHGEWIIGVQGGHQAEGDWPEFGPGQWVETNGSYGYGCACMNVRVDRKSRKVLEIKSAYARPLAACRKDRSLRKPTD